VKVLISGAAGYLGSVLTGKLLGIGHHVTGVDNFLYKQTSLNHYCSDPDFEIVNGDARDPGVIVPLLKKHDVIIPLAAIVGAPACDKDKTAAWSTNYEAIKLIINNISTEQRIIYPTTNSGYGIGDLDKECTEDSPLKPISIYGQTKVEAEKAVLDRSNSVSLRLATVFGVSPRMRLDLLLNSFTYQAVRKKSLIVFEGHFRRNFLHVKDSSNAMIYTLHNFESMKTMAFNIGLSDANLTKLQLCAKIKEHIPDFVYLEAPIGEDPDKRDYMVSNKKIENHGFKPLYDIDDGIEELIKAYKMLSDYKYGNAEI
jgi:nucleoside-diphosphate-sugar epimerase